MKILAVDLGQSGARIRIENQDFTSNRAKLAGEDPIDSLRAIFVELPKLQCEIATLSLTGFNGIVTDENRYAALCNEFFGAKSTLVIDDGLAGYIGTLGGRSGVTILIGSGVVSVGGKNGIFSHLDGLGSIFGDEGSGYWLGKHALTRALATEEDRDSNTELLRMMQDEVTEFHALKSKNGVEAATLAIKSAKSLLVAADAGNYQATEIRDQGAILLAKTVCATWRGVDGRSDEELEVVINGGLARNLGYYNQIKSEVLKELPKAKFVQPEGDNLSGAIWLAENMSKDAPPMMRWARIQKSNQ